MRVGGGWVGGKGFKGECVNNGTYLIATGITRDFWRKGFPINSNSTNTQGAAFSTWKFTGLLTLNMLRKGRGKTFVLNCPTLTQGPLKDKSRPVENTDFAYPPSGLHEFQA